MVGERKSIGGIIAQRRSRSGAKLYLSGLGFMGMN